jgi:hypothetical protein
MSPSNTARRYALRTLGALAVAPLAAPLAAALIPVAQAQALPAVEVFKTPSCGCCGDWIKHLEANGFKVTAVNVPDLTPVRAKLGMPVKFGSCHTARVGGYLVEGHVPAREVKRLLREKPQAVGISVPGMPIGSPGMDGPVYKGMQQPYDVLLVQADGSSRVFASYNKR